MSTWDGSGMSQEDFMHKDECIVLDENDRVIGHENKYNCHRFNHETPRGVLHRAFSVFLFNEEGKLLLQQRASSKITFPDVWTNTCCSHPLYGYNPPEVDTPVDVANGTVMGVKNAAVRKLKHELGIEAEEVPIEKFKFLTRLHYWAADTVTHGAQSEWGEHEIDYILFIQAKVTCKPHPDEVRDIKYVTIDELRRQMDPKTPEGKGLLWSPWFRIIVERFLPKWWGQSAADLTRTLTTDCNVDTRTIHRFDSSRDHWGGGGGAGLWLDNPHYRIGMGGNISGKYHADRSPPAEIKYSNGTTNGCIVNGGGKGSAAAVAKQGAYGKIPTHAEPKLGQLMRVGEVTMALYLKTVGMPSQLKIRNEHERFCDGMLGRVSRSFAAVIRQLPRGLAMDVLIFYLVLRGLDTIEDDMVAFGPDTRAKVSLLTNFHEKCLGNEEWAMAGVGEGDEEKLLEHFYSVSIVFNRLDSGSREVIRDITRRMGGGMAEFVTKDLGQGTTTVTEYNRYCHFVAGLVGEGLSRLFVAKRYEDGVVGLDQPLANDMGLFLQKTNIIRDYLEDLVDNRAWWPSEIWSKYTTDGKLEEFAREVPRTSSSAASSFSSFSSFSSSSVTVPPKGGGLSCLNEMVTDALDLVPSCLLYMGRLRNRSVFKFCAIPQVMAIATLDKCYDNPDVFTGVVKIRKGLAASMIVQCHNLTYLQYWFRVFATSIKRKTSAIRARTTQQMKNNSSGGSSRSAAAELDHILALCKRTSASCDVILRSTRFAVHFVQIRQALFVLFLLAAAGLAVGSVALALQVLAPLSSIFTNAFAESSSPFLPGLLWKFAVDFGGEVRSIGETLAVTPNAVDGALTSGFSCTCSSTTLGDGASCWAYLTLAGSVVYAVWYLVLCLVFRRSWLMRSQAWCAAYKSKNE